MSYTPKILYVEDELATNIPRLLLLFKEFLGEAEQKRLEELEDDLTGYGADPEEIKEIFNSIEFIDIEYRFPDALAKVLTQPEEYSLFLIDRNLASAEYTIEEVQKSDPHYSQDLHAQYVQREGDYILVKLVVEARVSVLEEKFYFLTAFPGEDEIRGIQKIKDRIDLMGFRRKNFIEKGNSAALQLLRDVFSRSPINKPEFYAQVQSSLVMEMYSFNMRDGSTIKGFFASPGIRIKTKNAKTTINTSQVKRITRAPQKNADFKVELKNGNIFQGRILDKKIKVETQLERPIYQVVPENIKSVELERT